MNKIKFLVLVFLFNVVSGCAFIDRTVLTPSAKMSRVEPLFVTKECSEYKPVNNNNFFDIRNPFVKNECESQTQSVGDSQITSFCNDNNKLKECNAYLMRISDDICSLHLSSIFGNQAVTNVSLGVLAAGTGIAGGLVPGLAAANALSGTSGFLTGSRALINEDVYQNYISGAIIKQILAKRKEVKNQIYSDLQNKTSSTGISKTEQIKQRVSEYHNECSFFSGVSSLVDSAAKLPILSITITKKIDSLKADLEKATGEKKEKIQAQKDMLESLLLTL